MGGTSCGSASTQHENGWRALNTKDVRDAKRPRGDTTSHLPEEPHQIDKRWQVLARTGERGTLVHCWWECKLVQPLWKILWRFLKKLKTELPYDPVIPLLGIFLKKTKTRIYKDISTPMLTAALFTVAKIWKQPKCPSTDEWMKKMYIHTMEYYSDVKSNEILPSVATWMDPEGVMLSEISQTQKDKHCVISLICGI